MNTGLAKRCCKNCVLICSYNSAAPSAEVRYQGQEKFGVQISGSPQGFKLSNTCLKKGNVRHLGIFHLSSLVMPSFLNSLHFQNLVYNQFTNSLKNFSLPSSLFYLPLFFCLTSSCPAFLLFSFHLSSDHVPKIH